MYFYVEGQSMCYVLLCMKDNGCYLICLDTYIVPFDFRMMICRGSDGMLSSMRHWRVQLPNHDK